MLNEYMSKISHHNFRHLLCMGTSPFVNTNNISVITLIESRLRQYMHAADINEIHNINWQNYNSFLADHKTYSGHLEYNYHGHKLDLFLFFKNFLRISNIF